MGSPSPFHLVELGPGRGTLARDVLKVITKFKQDAEFSMHMVEVSPFLSKAQAQRFCYTHDTLLYGSAAMDISARLGDVPHQLEVNIGREIGATRFDQGIV